MAPRMFDISTKQVVIALAFLGILFYGSTLLTPGQ